jgi:hypothetical protein
MSPWLQFFGILIGFGSVCLTLFANAFLAERRRLTDFAHERSTMRAALIAELNALDEAIGTRTSTLQVTPGFDTVIFHLFPVDDLFRIYRSFVGKLGLFTSYEVNRLVSLCSSVSGQLASINDNLRLVAAPSSTPGTIIIDVKNKDHVDESLRTIAALHMYQRAIQDVVDMLATCSKQTTAPLTVSEFLGQLRLGLSEAKLIAPSSDTSSLDDAHRSGHTV